MYMLVYVDDIIIVSSSPTATDKLLVQLKQDFVVKNLGTLSYFLGIEVSSIFDGILFTQKKYLQDLL